MASPALPATRPGGVRRSLVPVGDRRRQRPVCLGCGVCFHYLEHAPTLTLGTETRARDAQCGGEGTPRRGAAQARACGWPRGPQHPG